MKRIRIVAAGAIVLLAGCAGMPSGPSMAALPGTGKSFTDFRVDDADCRQYALQQVGGVKNDPGVRNAVVGTVIGAAAGAAIGGHQGAGVGAGAGLIVGSASGAEETRSANYGSQRYYDDSYIQCMYARGHKVPVSASFARSLTQQPAPAAPAVGTDIPPPPPGSPPPSVPPDYAPAPATR